jgi:hypothetical protein
LSCRAARSPRNPTRQRGRTKPQASARKSPGSGSLTPRVSVATRGPRSRFKIKERWLSGLKRGFAKPVTGKLVRRFESCPLRSLACPSVRSSGSTGSSVFWLLQRTSVCGAFVAENFSARRFYRWPAPLPAKSPPRKAIVSQPSNPPRSASAACSPTSAAKSRLDLLHDAIASSLPCSARFIGGQVMQVPLDPCRNPGHSPDAIARSPAVADSHVPLHITGKNGDDPGRRHRAPVLRL